ncbi:MAG: barstar family protein [Gemmatimonadaceae bacterium]
MTDSPRRFTTGAAWLHRIVADLPELTDWAWSLDRSASASLVMRVLRGRHMQTVTTLCDEMGAALQFPYYFGGNFNAIEDCLTDLDWLPGNSYVLVVTDAPSVLARADPDDVEAFLALLARVHEYWQHGGDAPGSEPVPFDVILHATEATAPRLQERLTGAHVVASELRIP